MGASEKGKIEKEIISLISFIDSKKGKYISMSDLSRILGIEVNSFNYFQAKKMLGERLIYLLSNLSELEK